MSSGVAVCADVGSTFTKVAAVDLDNATVLASAACRTTVDSDVLVGLDLAVESVVASGAGGATDIRTLDVCSSAGGGLRLAVVGYEQLVTSEAGHRVGLSAGARVVHVAAGRLDRSGVDALRAARPDVVLLVGGTDGGEVEVLVHNAGQLATARLRVPVVVAGNIDGRDGAMAVLVARGVPAIATENVLPRIGELRPLPARAAIRSVFLRHVIGGKRLSRGPRFASLVRGATPDVVLTAVELFADEVAGDLLVVDVGGATTDVYSVLHADPDALVDPDVAGTLWHSRTVEGDLGMRWSAPGVVAAAATERLLDPAEASWLDAAARVRADDPTYLPMTETDRRAEIRIAQLAMVIAVRRHARGGPAMTGTDRSHRGRRDLRRVRLLIGSGGVLRHAPAAVGATMLHSVLSDHAGGWAVPQAASPVVDTDYLLAPAGLLAVDHPATARTLLRRLLPAGTVGQHKRG
jgi:uncharacterized protein (TIGR01319 family)